MPEQRNRTVAAKLLLSPADVDRFRIWHNRNGVFSSALEYHRFKYPHAHAYKTLSGDDIAARVYADPAKFCGHKLHPTAKQEAGYCPVCMVRFCLDFLDAIKEKFVEVGGPLGVIKGKQATYFELRVAWRTARLELAALASRYEVTMDMERIWDMERAGDTRHHGTMFSATAALQLMHRCYKYPAPIAPSKKAAHRKTMIPERDIKKKQKKTVRFATDIKLCAGRPSNRFFRQHPTYPAATQHLEIPSGKILHSIEAIRMRVNRAKFSSSHSGPPNA